MCDAGRIKHYLRHNLGRLECAIVIIGSRAAGTLGRRLVDGEKRVRLFGGEHAARASIHTIAALSAHADRDTLLGWFENFTMPPSRTFMVHGEAATACGFGHTIAESLSWNVEAPAAGSHVDL